MPKYFAKPNNAKIFRWTIPCPNISLCHTTPKYFAVSYHVKIFRWTIPCQNISLCHTLPQYFSLPNHAKIFCSVIPWQISSPNQNVLVCQIIQKSLFKFCSASNNVTIYLSYSFALCKTMPKYFLVKVTIVSKRYALCFAIPSYSKIFMSAISCINIS